MVGGGQPGFFGLGGLFVVILDAQLHQRQQAFVGLYSINHHGGSGGELTPRNASLALDQAFSRSVLRDPLIDQRQLAELSGESLPTIQRM